MEELIDKLKEDVRRYGEEMYAKGKSEGLNSTLIEINKNNLVTYELCKYIEALYHQACEAATRSKTVCDIGAGQLNALSRIRMFLKSHNAWVDTQFETKNIMMDNKTVSNFIEDTLEGYKNYGGTIRVVYFDENKQDKVFLELKYKDGKLTDGYDKKKLKLVADLGIIYAHIIYVDSFFYMDYDVHLNEEATKFIWTKV